MVESTALVPIPIPIPPTASRRTRFWGGLGRGAQLVGRAVGRGSRTLGRALASAYRAVDPDVRQHIAQLPVVGLSMLVPRPRGVVPLPEDGFRPLILVHGLGGRPGNFAGLKAYSRARGRRRVYLVDFSKDRSIDQMSARLSDFIACVLEVNGLAADGQVDLVAHSLGGIIVRLALCDDGVAARVATVVTLGSPHQGTHLARFASTSVTLGLRPGSDLMRELDRVALNGVPGHVRTVAFWSQADVFMLPAEGAMLPGAENIELTGVTHYGYLLSPTCWNMIFAALVDA